MSAAGRASAISDRLVAVLMRSRVRRIRRWSFVLTLPAAVLVAQVVGLRGGAVLLAVRVALWAAVAVIAWRAGGERGEVLRDLLMHPRARAFLRAELDVLLTLPRLAREARRARRHGPAGALRYSRGDFGPAIALALTPPTLAEAAIVHLLLPPGWIAAHVATAVAHLYALLWLFGWAVGSRAYPHRLAGGTLIARSGPLYRARVPLDAVAEVVVARERVPDPGGLGFGALVERDGTARLVGRGRVDVRLELSRPVLVQRPLSDPVSVTILALASDDPEAFARLLSGPATVQRRAVTRAWPAAGGAFDAAGLLRDALQPA